MLKILTNILYWHSKYLIPKSKNIYSEFSSILDGCMIKLKEFEKGHSKLPEKIFDSELYLNLDAYEKIQIKIEKYFADIK